jgi:hypothetical protein
VGEGQTGSPSGREPDSGPRAYSENPAKTRPFPGQNSGVHNPALSSCSAAEVGPTVPSAPRALANSAAESKIENPNSKIPWSRIPNRNSESKTNEQSQLTIHDSPLDDFGGESVPVSPFGSTREWLERQGIQVSRIPKGARIITAG